jgi:IstB-like ATP binding protein
VLDDLALRPLTAEQAADLLEIVDDRHGRRSTIITSQLPVDHWHDNLGEPTIADALCDRITHGTHRVQLPGESMRKPSTPTTPEPPRSSPRSPSRRILRRAAHLGTIADSNVPARSRGTLMPATFP